MRATRSTRSRAATPAPAASPTIKNEEADDDDEDDDDEDPPTLDMHDDADDPRLTAPKPDPDSDDNERITTTTTSLPSSSSPLSSIPPDLQDPAKEAPQTSTTTSTRSTLKRAPSDASPAPSKRARPNTKTVTTTTHKTPTRAPAKRIRASTSTSTSTSISASTAPPANWEETWRLTTTMRAQVLAPVDTMGCESLADPSVPPKEQRFQTLVSLMLSSQTKDTVTAAAVRALQRGLPGGLTVEAVRGVNAQELDGMIRSVGFHNNKTRFLKATAEILAERYGGDIPDSIEGLVALPGVGPKMGYLTLSAAWGRDEGIGVDVHVHRITNLWGWHRTKTPEQTRARLEAWLPRDKWHGINTLLVGFGQTWCPPVGRKCEKCLLAKGLCPSAVIMKTTKKTKTEKAEGEEAKVTVEYTP